MIQQYEINGNTFKGYLASPPEGNCSGILIFHAWWGLNNFQLDTCDILAKNGFVALAPDYYGGEIAKNIDEAIVLRRKFNRKDANKIATFAADYLVSKLADGKDRIGTVGFSLGASLAIDVARKRTKTVKAVVLFYGTGGGKLDKTDAYFMGHYAEKDEWGANSARMNAFADRIRASQHDIDLFVYPTTEHWFAEADRPEYDEIASKLAWERTIEFLHDRLG